MKPGNSIRLETRLHRISVNACLMRLRRRKRRPEEPVDPKLPEFDRYGFRIGPSEIGPFDADELLERVEIRERLRREIDRLPESYRAIPCLACRPAPSRYDFIAHGSCRESG